MLYQRTPLPPDIEYFLDCANEEGMINSFDHVALTLLGDRKTVMKIVDNRPDAPGRRLRARYDIARSLDAYAHELVSEISLPEQRAFAAVGMRWEPLRMIRIAEYIVHWTFTDATIGGCAIPMRDDPRADRNYDPTPRARRHLYSPAAIRRHVKLEDQSLPMARHMAAGLRRLPAAKPGDDELVQVLAAEQRESYRETYRAARAKFEAEQRARYRPTSAATAIERKVIRRAAGFCAGLIGSDKVSAFARGEPVALAGRDMVLTVAKNRGLASLGHGALDVALCAPDGTRLANVCVFFDKTPAIDQLAAIALHVGAGDEGAIIKTGNLFNISKEGSRHPLVLTRLAQKAAPGVAEAAAAMDRINRHGFEPSRHERQLAAMRRYKADVIQIYLDAVKVQVWGRDSRRLDPFIDAQMDAIREALADPPLREAA